jgi:hypothetical protein
MSGIALYVMYKILYLELCIQVLKPPLIQEPQYAAFC